MNRFAAIPVLVVVSVWSAVALAQESAAPPKPPAPPAAEAAAPTAPPRSPASDEEFIPTEEISADEAVTFPVDI